MTDVDRERAEMLAAALANSGILATIDTQITSAITKGTVTIAQGKEDKKVLVAQAAETMAKGIEGAFNYLILNGYGIVRINNGKDTSMATEGRAESEGGLEREGSSISESGGPQSESAGEGNTEGSGGDET